MAEAARSRENGQDIACRDGRRRSEAARGRNWALPGSSAPRQAGARGGGRRESAPSARLNFLERLPGHGGRRGVRPERRPCSIGSPSIPAGRGRLRCCRACAALDDPLGPFWASGSGERLRIRRVSVPIGVIGIIYESRPNGPPMPAHFASCRGTRRSCAAPESWHSSRAIAGALRAALAETGLPAGCIQLVPTTDRAAVGILLGMDDALDLIVPRGGRSLIERVLAESRVPVMAHLDGNCHVYVHAAADPEKARDVTFNAKMRRTGICGAAETLLVDAAAAETLPAILEPLFEAGCEVRGDARVQAMDSRVVPVAAADWGTEYLDAIISVGVVDGLDAAISHVNEHGSHHTDSIITEDAAAAERFMEGVDSGIVLHNASTQFADGGEFGMGAEIGISTGKLHARGPVGVEQLTTYKYKVYGNGQVRP